MHARIFKIIDGSATPSGTSSATTTPNGWSRRTPTSSLPAHARDRSTRTCRALHSTTYCPENRARYKNLILSIILIPFFGQPAHRSEEGRYRPSLGNGVGSVTSVRAGVGVTDGSAGRVSPVHSAAAARRRRRLARRPGPRPGMATRTLVHGQFALHGVILQVRCDPPFPSPAKGSCWSVASARAASAVKPRRMSITPAASQTFVALGTGITRTGSGSTGPAPRGHSAH